jgi:hypothetical protein
MVAFSPREMRIIRQLTRWKQEDGHDHFTLEGLALAISGSDPHGAIGKHWRKSLAGTLRNLAAKCGREGVHLQRISRLGRSKEGVYEFWGDFAKLQAYKERGSP